MPGMTAPKAKPRAKIKKSSQKESAESRRKLFIEALLSNGENISKAALAAGFSPKSAAQQGSRLFKHVEVQQALNNRRTEVLEKCQLTTEAVTREIARLSFFDARKMFAADGRPLSITELDDDTAACIVGLDVLEEYEGSGEDRHLIGHVKKYKIADKNSALDKAVKILGLYQKDNEQKTDPFTTMLLAIAQGNGSSFQPVQDDPAHDED